MTIKRQTIVYLALVPILIASRNILSAQKPMEYRKTKAQISGLVRDAARAAERDPASANATFRVVEGACYEGQVPAASFRTDNKGNFHLELRPGVYSIVESGRAETFSPKESTAEEEWDNECRKKLWQTPLLVLHVKTLESRHIELSGIPADERSCLKQKPGHGK